MLDKWFPLTTADALDALDALSGGSDALAPGSLTRKEIQYCRKNPLLYDELPHYRNTSPTI